MADSMPSWAEGLERRSLYFEGFVDDVDSVLELHRRETVTYYGTRTSSTSKCVPDINCDSNKENMKTQPKVFFDVITSYTNVHACNMYSLY